MLANITSMSAITFLHLCFIIQNLHNIVLLNINLKLYFCTKENGNDTSTKNEI